MLQLFQTLEFQELIVTYYPGLRQGIYLGLIVTECKFPFIKFVIVEQEGEQFIEAEVGGELEVAVHGEWDAQLPLSIGAACLICQSQCWRKCTLGCQVLRERMGLSRSLHLQAGCNLLTLSLFLFLSFVSWKEKGVGGGRGRRLKEWKICFKVL